MPDISTRYLGLHLKNPLVVSASPLSRKVETVQRLEDAGAAAIVMYSLFEEQITHESHQLDYFLSRATHSYAEAISYFPDLEYYNLGLPVYLRQIEKLKQAVNIPVIGSLNGVSTGSWIEYAKLIEEAGADALELNIYYLPTDPFLSSSELEDTYVELVRSVRAEIKIPLALKLSPFFTSLPSAARRFVEAGADGLVLFNRFYQPDFDLENLQVVPNIEFSTSADLRLPLRWIAILYGRLDVDFALTSGVHNSKDIVKAMMAGSNVAMVASELLANGIGRVTDLLSGLQHWMEEYEYQSVGQMRGSMSQKAVSEPAAFERANYLRALSSLDHHHY